MSVAPPSTVAANGREPAAALFHPLMTALSGRYAGASSGTRRVEWTYIAAGHAAQAGGPSGGSGACIGLLGDTYNTATTPAQPAMVPGSYKRTEAYDPLCRPLTTTTQLGGTSGPSFTTTTVYDSYGRYAGTSYPDTYAVKWAYNASGYVSEVSGLTVAGGSTYTPI